MRIDFHIKFCTENFDISFHPEFGSLNFKKLFQYSKRQKKGLQFF